MTDPRYAEAMKLYVSKEPFPALEKLSVEDLKYCYNHLLPKVSDQYERARSERLLTMITYEISRRENDRSFKKMWWATCLAIGLAAFQVAWEIFTWYMNQP